jgi:hypothetical protein
MVRGHRHTADGRDHVATGWCWRPGRLVRRREGTLNPVTEDRESSASASGMSGSSARMKSAAPSVSDPT